MLRVMMNGGPKGDSKPPLGPGGPPPGLGGPGPGGPPPPPPGAGGPPPQGGAPQGAGLPSQLMALMGGSDGDDSSKVKPDTAGYLPPEHGPFMCGHCVHFDGQGSCEIVSGPIDAQGCCNLFESGDSGPDQSGQMPPQGPPDDETGQ